MAAAIELRQHQQFGEIEGTGTTTSDLLNTNLIADVKIPRDLEDARLVLWACSTVTRSDLPPTTQVADPWIQSHVQILKSFLFRASQSCRVLANLKPLERTNRSEVIMLPWESPTEDFRNQFYFQVLSELELEPVEDGIPHPVERIMQDILTKSSQVGRDWVKGSFQQLVEEKKDSAAAGLLQCIGRIKCKALGGIISDLVVQGLAHSNAEVREAAISVVEQLEDKAFVSILSKHEDSVSWLGRYAKQVLSEISEKRD
jgi:hypothetical protein